MLAKVRQAALLNSLLVVFMGDLNWSRRTTVRENYRETEKAVLDAILGQGYDKRIRPSGQNSTESDGDGPSHIIVDTMIRSISKIDDYKMVSARP